MENFLIYTIFLDQILINCYKFHSFLLSKNKGSPKR